MRTQPEAAHLEYQVPLVTKWHLGGTVSRTHSPLLAFPAVVV